MFTIKLINDDPTKEILFLSFEYPSNAAYWTRKEENAKNFASRKEAETCARLIAMATIGSVFGSTDLSPSLLHVGLQLTPQNPTGTGRLFVQKLLPIELETIPIQAEIVPHNAFLPKADPANPNAVVAVYAVCSIVDSLSNEIVLNNYVFQTTIHPQIQNRATIALHCRKQFMVAFEAQIRNDAELAKQVKGKVLCYNANLLPNFYQAPPAPAKIALSKVTTGQEMVAA